MDLFLIALVLLWATAAPPPAPLANSGRTWSMAHDRVRGPVTVKEVARRHGMTWAQAEEVAEAAGIDPNKWDFTYMVRSDANRFLKELYRRRGLKIRSREERARQRELGGES